MKQNIVLIDAQHENAISRNSRIAVQKPFKNGDQISLEDRAQQVEAQRMKKDIKMKHDDLQL